MLVLTAIGPNNYLNYLSPNNYLKISYPFKGSIYTDGSTARVLHFPVAHIGDRQVSVLNRVFKDLKVTIYFITSAVAFSMKSMGYIYHQQGNFCRCAAVRVS